MMSRASMMESATSSLLRPRLFCCGLAEAQGLGLSVVGHPWGDGCSRLPDPFDSFGFAAPAVIDDCGLRECDLPEV